MTLTYLGCIVFSARASEKCRGRQRSHLSESLAALLAGSLMAKELFVFFEREFTNRR
jgi:hypothetical protein